MHANYFSRMRLLITTSLMVFVLAPMAYSATTIATIGLNNSHFEKFGALYFPFLFQVPETWALCEFGIDPNQPTQCVNNVVSDYITVTNNQFGEGVVAMISDPTEGPLVVPPDFPVPPQGSPYIPLKETGRPQILTPRAGIPTVLPTGGPGPFIQLTAMSDLDTTPPPVVSDKLTVATVP
jgi:hypothetical protein